MGQYRKKPVVINAIQWKGWNTPEIVSFSKSEDINKTHPTWLFGGGKIHIPTLEGTMTADKDDWIIKGIHGEFYPCKPEIFEKSYECIDKVAKDNHLQGYSQDYAQTKGASTAPLMHI